MSELEIKGVKPLQFRERPTFKEWRDWVVTTYAGCSIGRIGWCCPFDCYAFFPKNAAIVSTTHSRQITEFLEKHTKEHKEKPKVDEVIFVSAPFPIAAPITPLV
jgi:hypothetical protein